MNRLKLKSIAFGNPQDNSNHEAIEQQRSLSEKQALRPFPQQVFMQYVRTLSDYDKLMLAIALQMPFTKKDLRKWPDLLFLKKLSIVIKKATTDLPTRQLLFIYISSIMIDDPPSIEEMNKNLEQLISNYGYWNMYWSIFYHSEREKNEELCNQMLEQLNSTLLTTNESMQEVAATTKSETTVTEDHNKYEKKIAILEDKISKEIATRQQLELSGVKKDKMNRQLLQEQDKLIQQVEQLKEQLQQYEQQANRAEQTTHHLIQRKKDEEERWLQERAQLLQQNKQYADEQKKLLQAQEQLNKELEDSKKQLYHVQQMNHHQKLEATKISQVAQANGNIMEQLTMITFNLHREVNKWNEEILLTADQASVDSHEKRKEYREQMIQTLQLIDSIETYQHNQLQYKPQLEQKSEDPVTKEAEEKTIAQPTDNTINGTFYRRDHGGYIALENGDVFNITESLVQQLELQHEAEVLCTPTAHPGRSNHYTIELLFQGDDNFSPIRQYDGYVHLDEDQKWYCIDMNNEDNIFPIHFKDIEIQKPAHGDPCTFNVAEDGHIARLTKLYRLHGETIDVHPARKKFDKPKEATPANTRQKVEPYLEGTTITIIGGQRKWFESVVKETGAELVHDGGERPERIASDLSRSQALFMILTSTSHRATWEGVEIAKANNIPHFVIQGSKSNLRMLLWENQDIIRNSNAAV